MPVVVDALASNGWCELGVPYLLACYTALPDDAFSGISIGLRIIPICVQVVAYSFGDLQVSIMLEQGS